MREKVKQSLKLQTSTTNTSNTCLNSLAERYWGIEARVFHVIDDSEIELTPMEISRKIHAPRKPTRGQCTTVRVCVRKLLEKGLIVQPYPGAYCNKITHGVRFLPLCVHNIVLLSKLCQDVQHWVADEVVGGVKLHVCFGSERRQVSGYIACDVGGMSHDACLLALNRWFEIVEGRLGWALSDLILKTVEFNKDYHGRRIDGFQCVTKQELYGVIDRTYQKEENVVRKERKVTQPMSINKFEAEIRKNIDEIGHTQDFFELQDGLRKNTEALKFNNNRLLQLEKFSEANSKAMCRLMDFIAKIPDIESPLRIAEGQKRLGEYIA